MLGFGVEMGCKQLKSFPATLGIISLFSCFLLTRSTMALEVSEAQQIALESSGELLPPGNLVQRIEKDLTAIRSKFPAVAGVTHTPKWTAGKVMVQDVKKEALDAINSSPYGPSEAKAIFQDKIFLVTFNKPYNPEKLKEVLEKELGIPNARPDGVIGGSSKITLTADAGSGKNTYEFMKGSGDCMSGCINKHFWTFVVGPDENVELTEERGDELGDDGEDRPVGMFGIH